MDFSFSLHFSFLDAPIPYAAFKVLLAVASIQGQEDSTKKFNATSERIADRVRLPNGKTMDARNVRKCVRDLIQNEYLNEIEPGVYQVVPIPWNEHYQRREWKKVAGSDYPELRVAATPFAGSGNPEPRVAATLSPIKYNRENLRKGASARPDGVAEKAVLYFTERGLLAPEMHAENFVSHWDARDWIGESKGKKKPIVNERDLKRRMVTWANIAKEKQASKPSWQVEQLKNAKTTKVETQEERLARLNRGQQ